LYLGWRREGIISEPGLARPWQLEVFVWCLPFTVRVKTMAGLFVLLAATISAVAGSTVYGGGEEGLSHAKDPGGLALVIPGLAMVAFGLGKKKGPK
jgi:hypothetical protein